MGDVLSEGNDWLEEQRREHMVTTVEYRRGTYVIPAIEATLGRTAGERADRSGLSVRVTQRDFLFATEELVDQGGNPLEPERGDKIVVELEGEFQEFEVNVMAAGEPAWQWSDAYHRVRRVHAKWNGAE